MSKTTNNVLLVVPWDQESGGVASVVGHLARHLDGDGRSVLFLHPGASEVVRPRTTKWGFRGVELNLRTPLIPGRRLRSAIAFLLTLPFTVFQLMRLIRKSEIGVVNIHYPIDAFFPFAICRALMKFRLVISVHGMDVFRWRASARSLPLALRMLFRTADLVVAPSSRFADRCSALFASCKAPRIAIHNGIDLTELSAGKPMLPARSRRIPMILSVCSLDEWKGLDVLLHAMALLRDGGTRAHLVIAGEGPMRKRLEHLISDLMLEEEVELLGQQPREEITRLLHECTVFVLASRFESFGIAVLEALACAKPVVGTRVDGILEIIDDGKSGLLVDPDDAVSLAAAIHRLLSDRDLRESLGRAGRRRAGTFRWQSMGERYSKAFSCPTLPIQH